LEIFDVNPVLPIDTTTFNGMTTAQKDTALLNKINELIDRNKTLLTLLRENQNALQGNN
tara:strand:+ start:988 stop:1164 length:177 start_codon:yes stop_codon:yes gene_type:complete